MEMYTINLTPLLVLICVDVFALNMLWKERYDRRLLHHLQNSNYNSRKIPIIYKIKDMLTGTNIAKVLSLKYREKEGLNTKSKWLSKLFGGQYSKRSSLYFNSFDKPTQTELENIALSIKPNLEEICGEKLELAHSSFRCSLLRYEGTESNVDWHYDNEPYNCYRTLCLVKSEGTLSPFLYKDSLGKVQPIKLTIGDGILFKGTQTHHKVEPSGDPNTVRWMLGFQYFSGKYPDKARSFCSELRGANILTCIKLFLPKMFLLTFAVQGSNLILPEIIISTKNYIIIPSGIILMSYFLPKHTNTIGTGIISTNYSIFSYLLIMNLHYFSPFISIGHLSYLLLTEMLLPSSMVSHTIENGGS